MAEECVLSKSQMQVWFRLNMRTNSQTYTWERLAQEAVTFLTWVLAKIN